MDPKHLPQVPGNDPADNGTHNILQDEERESKEGSDEFEVHKNDEEHRPQRLGGDAGEEPGQSVEDVGTLSHYLLAAFRAKKCTVLGHAAADRLGSGIKKARVLTPAGM